MMHAWGSEPRIQPRPSMEAASQPTEPACQLGAVELMKPKTCPRLARTGVGEAARIRLVAVIGALQPVSSVSGSNSQWPIALEREESDPPCALPFTPWG